MTYIIYSLLPSSLSPPLPLYLISTNIYTANNKYLSSINSFFFLLHHQLPSSAIYVYINMDTVWIIIITDIIWT